MYTHVYEGMVHAGVAEKLDEEIMMDKEGNEVLDHRLMYGRPTKYKVTHPEKILFVDEAGSNTNQKDDGRIGGKLFVVPTIDEHAGMNCAVTDIRFTILCFTSATGVPAMCAVIFVLRKT